MGAEAFEAALGAGRALSATQAVALALDQCGRAAATNVMVVPSRDGRNSMVPG
jgi:hypothetical protein